MTEQGGVKYQSKAHCSCGFWSCCSEAPMSPQLPSAHQGQVSLPIPAGIPHQTARGAFYPEQNAAACHSGGSVQQAARMMAKFNTPEWKSIPGRGGVAKAQVGGGGGDRWKGHQENWDLEKHSLSQTKAQEARWCQARELMSRFTLSTLCQFWRLTIKAKHLYFFFPFSTNYCKGYCFCGELGSSCASSSTKTQWLLRLISLCFDL